MTTEGSVLLNRVLTLSTVTVAVRSGLDGQGMPSYASGVEISARTKIEDKMVRSADGSEVRSSLTLWVPSDQTPVPSEGDRVTWVATDYIVLEQKEVRRLHGGEDATEGALIHTRLRLREE